MCGICGIVDYKKEITNNNLSKMVSLIKHRGPDDDGIYLESFDKYKIGFGHTRLSIIDLSKNGHQPMGIKKSALFVNDEELNNSDYIITYNGEIYNFNEIKEELISKGHQFKSRSDTEVLLRGYIEYKEEILNKLNGMFSFVIFDKKKDLLFGARDRFGKKPLKYYYDDKRFIFASELKAITSQRVKTEIDYDSLDDYLTLRYIPSPKTGLKNIFKLPHSKYFKFNIPSKKLEIRKYWDLDYSKKIKSSKREIRRELEDRLNNSVKKRLISDVEVGAFLSGGVDSSAIVAFASNFKKRLKTFNIRFDEKKFDESEYAKIVSKKFNTDHNEFTVKPNDLLNYIDKIVYQYEEPYAEYSNLPIYILSEKTSMIVKVVLNGDGGDENFAGYDKYQKHLFSRFFKYLPFKKIYASIFLYISKLLKSSLFYKLYIFFNTLNKPYYYKHINYSHSFDEEIKYKMFKDEIKIKLNNSTYNNLTLNINNRLNYLDKILYMDFNNYIPNTLMPKVDIATMAHGLEARSPLLDYEFVEYTAKIPPKFKMTLTSRKKIFKEMLKKYLSKNILYRKKRGFNVPLDSWFRNELKTYIRENLLEEKNLVMEIFKEASIKKLLEEHFDGKNNGDKLWILLMLNKWGNLITKNLK